MPIIDFDREFESFVMGNEGSVITDIYKILPSLDQEQIQIIQQLYFYIERYNLTDLEVFVTRYVRDMARNKNLGLFKTAQVKQLLKSYTMEEMLKGVKIQNRQPQDGGM